tara:strand:+ start:262 stop:717 length:456 start_codon:yes stop_codon:yes gene_type:complete
MHIVHGQLRKAPLTKSGVGKDGQSTMFAVELSEMIKDYKTGEKLYSNYKAILFASSDAHVNHYNQTLVKGNFIVLTSEKLKIEVSECGQYTKLYMDNARLEGSNYIQPQQQQGGFQQQPSQKLEQKRQQAQQQSSERQPGQDIDFDDDIPF